MFGSRFAILLGFRISLLGVIFVTAHAFSVEDDSHWPTLSESQNLRLHTAQDHSLTFDEAALYPLLENATEISTSTNAPPQTQPAAMITLDVALMQEIANNPAAHRGEIFVIHGQLASVPRSVGRLARGGAWENKLQQWVIKIGQRESDVAVVYLVDPPLSQNRPRVGEAVYCVARFFKWWDQPLLRHDDDKTVAFATFVGRTIRLDLSAKNDETQIALTENNRFWRWGFPFVLVCMMAIYTLTRWRMRVYEKRKITARAPAPSFAAPSQISETDPTLPANPAQALSQLSHKPKP